MYGSQDSKEELELKIKGLEKDMQVVSLSILQRSSLSMEPLARKVSNLLRLPAPQGNSLGSVKKDVRVLERMRPLFLGFGFSLPRS
jgi:hypothetical protein